MKTLILLFGLFCTNTSIGQSFVQRLYAVGETGFFNYFGAGLATHFNNHLSIAVGYSKARVKQYPCYDPSTNGLLSSPNCLFNKVTKYSILAGISTVKETKVNFSLFSGIAYLQHETYDNIHKVDSPFSNSQTLKYNHKFTSNFGLIMRATFNVALTPMFGFHLGYEHNFNSIQNTNVFMFGLNIGIVRRMNGKQEPS